MLSFVTSWQDDYKTKHSSAVRCFDWCYLFVTSWQGDYKTWQCDQGNMQPDPEIPD
jgi:hypothetical protein